MRQARLEDMVRGWFAGDFTPTALRAAGCEVAVKRYRAGACEALHHHRIATEVTVIVSGKVEMMQQHWGPDDIVVLSPGEATAFRAITDAVCVVVKSPAAADDKFDGAA